METTKQSMTVEDVSNIFHAREFAYDILRRAFIEEPSREYLEVFTEKNLIHLFPFQDDSKGIKEAVSKVKDYLNDHNPAKIEKNYDSLHWDFTKLFIGPFDVLASPWESAYVHHDGLLFQETTLNVRKRYKQFGFEVKEYNVEADDHIGLELDFMFHLNHLAIVSVEENSYTTVREIVYLLKEQKSFIEEHLEKFVPALTKEMEEHADTQFYKGMAMLLRNFLIIDSQVLDELLNIELTKE